MKRSIGLIVVCCLTAFLHAETIKMKDGSLISGSILSQTQYTLNLATSYGNITLNQREIEQILPDKHRIVLSGGTQLIGVITDLDEFNLKLQTEEGTIVNIDMPQIVSIESYDYDRGAEAQKEFVEKTQQQQAAQLAAAQTIAQGTVQAEGGLTFDSDINQVFDSKNATVVNGTVVTPRTQTQSASPKFLTEEEPSPASYTQEQKKELLKKNSDKPKTEKVRPNEKEFSKYFALQIGARPTDLKLDNSSSGNYWSSADNAIDVGGTGVAVSGKFLWRLGGSNLWVGPFLGISNIPTASFEDKDSTVQDDPSRYPDPTAKTSGRILELGASAHYYVNPKNRFAFYLVGTAGLEMLQLNYRGELQSHSMSSNGFFAGGGIGVETWVDDLMIGLEARELYAKRSNRLSGSSATNLVIQLQTSWKF